MASIRKIAGNRWRAEVARQGVRKSKVFDTKQQAKDWSAHEEHQIINSKPAGETTSLRAAFDRYAIEVSPTRRGERWEVIRLAKLGRDRIADIMLSGLKAADIADWRDRRLKEVKPGSVKREMELISAVLSIARAEWGLIQINPMVDVRRPPKPQPRKRRISPAEFEALAICAGSDLSKVTAREHHAFLFAVETAMRAGEIISLTPERIDIAKRTAHLPITKNGTARDVPLSTTAVALLEALPPLNPTFGLSSEQLDALWRKLRDRAAVMGLTFHDSRHEAITRLARKVDVLDLARIVGHKNISQLLGYYDATASEIADRLG